VIAKTTSHLPQHQAPQVYAAKYVSQLKELFRLVEALNEVQALLNQDIKPLMLHATNI
jgi:hypothetical protein